MRPTAIDLFMPTVHGEMVCGHVMIWDGVCGVMMCGVMVLGNGV